MASFSASAASSYLANPFLVSPVAGYEKVASTAFTEAMREVVNQKFQGEMGLAGITLQQLGRLQEQKDLLDYNKWAFGQEQKQKRRDALRMAGAGLLQAMAGGGIQLPGLTDPRQEQINNQSVAAAMRQYRNGRMTGSSATAAAVLKGLG